MVIVDFRQGDERFTVIEHDGAVIIVVAGGNDVVSISIPIAAYKEKALKPQVEHFFRRAI